MKIKEITLIIAFLIITEINAQTTRYIIHLKMYSLLMVHITKISITI
jgi:hypothetical protein